MPLQSLPFSGSSMIRDASWNDETGELYVTMASGKTYTTPDVKPEVWKAFMEAPSKGRWYRENVLGAPE